MSAGFFTDESNRLRTVWRLVIFLVALLVAHLMLGVVVVVVMATGIVPAGVTEFVRRHNLLLAGILLLLETFIIVGPVVVCRLFLDRRDVWSLGLGKPDPRPTASPWVGLALGVMAAALPVLVLLLLLGRFRYGGALGSAAPLALVPILVLAAFHEELVFRGYLLQNMIEAGRPAAGVVLTAVLFALVHAMNPAFFASPWNPAGIFAAGVLLGVAYLVSGNLWFPTALHFGWNFTLGGIFGLPVSGLPLEGLLELEASGRGLLTGGDFGIEGSPLAIAVLMLMGLLLWAWHWVRSSRARQEPTHYHQ